MAEQQAYAEEDQIRARAEEADIAREDAFAEAAPVGTYSVESLNLLVDSLNGILPLFEVEDPYPSFEAGIEDGPLPPEFVAAIEMIAMAARDAGLERLAPNVVEATDDSKLEEAAGAIDALADNETFRSFLRAPMEAEEEVAAEDEMAAEADTAIADEEADALFAERL
jgi:hypothetical protein